jgi:hypothetical protein
MGSHSARPPSTSTVAHSRQAREETVTLTASPDRSARRSGARLTRSKNRSSETARYHATVEWILLLSEQDAGTLVWLATAVQMSLASGRFWHDRRGQPEYPLPWTRETDPSTARSSGTTWPRRPPRTHPKLAQAGRDSVAAARSSLRGGRDDRAAAA